MSQMGDSRNIKNNRLSAPVNSPSPSAGAQRINLQARLNAVKGLSVSKYNTAAHKARNGNAAQEIITP